MGDMEIYFLICTQNFVKLPICMRKIELGRDLTLYFPIWWAHHTHATGRNNRWVLTNGKHTVYFVNLPSENWFFSDAIF